LLSWFPPSCPLSLSLSLSLNVKLPFPSSGIWAALPGPPDPRRCPHCSQGISSTSVCLQSPYTTAQSSLKVLSQWVLHTYRSLISRSHFLEILVLGFSSLPWGLGPLELWAPSEGEVPPRSPTSTPEEPISHILSSVQASPWELDHSKSLQTPHWDVSWPTLGPFA
jgi:hypothetical protein